MALSDFAVVYARDDYLDDPLVHCYDGKQLILAFIARAALEDYFHIPGDRRMTLRERNLIIDRNLPAFERIISTKYDQGKRSVYAAHGQSYPRIDVNLADMQHSGEEFTADVVKLDAGFRSHA